MGHSILAFLSHFCPGVGKSALTDQFIPNHFLDGDVDPIVGEFKYHHAQINNFNLS